MPTPISSALGSQRRATYVLTSSNASFPIPSWAQGGKGIVYVTGCGGGASGTIGNADFGTGGGAGAFAVGHQIIIPAATTTLAAVIGTGGSAVTGAGLVNGTPGGQTSLTVGSTVLRLNGGGNGLAASSSAGGWAYVNSVSFVNTGVIAGSLWQGGTGNAFASNGLSAGAASLGAGAAGGAGTQQSGAYGAGGSGPFGSSLLRYAAASVNANGANAEGFGAGGQGAAWLSGGSVTSGAGAPGFLTLEFVEGF